MCCATTGNKRSLEGPLHSCTRGARDAPLDGGEHSADDESTDPATAHHQVLHQGCPEHIRSRKRGHPLKERVVDAVLRSDGKLVKIFSSRKNSDSMRD